MAQYTVFGSNTPSYPTSVYDDGTPNITLGNYFYVYGAMSSGWHCTGGRLWIPSSDSAIHDTQVVLSIWKTASNGTPVDLSTPPLQQKSTTTPSGGWAEVTWNEAVPVAAGELVFIAYSFTAARQNYYIHSPNPTANFVRSIEDADLCLAEEVLSTQPTTRRGEFKIGETPQGASGAWYGADIIVSDNPINLLAEYGFNETNGTTANDTSGNNRHLTVNAPENFNVGREGNALHQVGDGLAHQITNTAPWFETEQRTIMFWGRRGDEGTDQSSSSVYQLDGSGNTTFGIKISDGTNAVFTARINGTPITLTAPEVTAGTWAHYALAYDSNSIKAYIDGVEVGSQAVSGTIDASDGNLYLFGEDYQQQVIDDLRLFASGLTIGDITAYMNTVVPAPDTEPPTMPANLSVTAVDQIVTLNWDASTDNVAIQNYVVYRSDVSGFTPAPADQVGGPENPTFTDIAPVGTWYYRVSARDEAGNESAPSAEVEVISVAADGYYFPSALGWSLGNQITDNLANGLIIGHLFAVSSVTEIAGARFYSPIPQSGLSVRVYRGGNLEAAKYSIDVTTGWNMMLLDVPYVANPGEDYIVAIGLPAPSQTYMTLENAPWAAGGRSEVGPMYTTLSNSSRYTTDLSQSPGLVSWHWYGVDAVVLADTNAPIDPTFGATIVEENAKTGALGHEFTISGAGDVNNLGFARQFSVNAGETVDFSCHGDGTVIDIYRIGDYGGRGWRKVASLTNTATSQPDPVTIPDSNGGVECSNWSTTASWDVPADALSGLFVGVYRNAALNNASYIPFVVRNDSRAADVAYKTSDTTWALAYNYYGTPSSPLTGKSVYGSGGPLGSAGTRSFVGSYLRPIVTRAGISQTYWMACEAPMIRFLERNGIDVKYVASRDVDAGITSISNTNVAVSSGHDEYWSDGMRDTFEAFRDSGKHLLFFSGNEVFWRIRFDETRSKMWCHKDTLDGPGAHVGGTPLDPVSWTGTWKDTRWANRKPENLLTGTDFRMNGVSDHTAIFDQSFGTHPFWRDTSLSSGNISVNGIVGFEADELAPDQPEGSYTILANHVININGSRADDNGQSYNGNGDLNWGVVSQRYASGAVVVGFGTCQWAWGLDAIHDRGGNYTNPAMQQATLNLFADLGAPAATVIAGLVNPTPLSSLDAYGLVPSSGRSGKIKVWKGSQWDAHPLKVWDGSTWVVRKAKGHDGAGFKEGK